MVTRPVGRAWILAAIVLVAACAAPESPIRSEIGATQPENEADVQGLGAGSQEDSSKCEACPESRSDEQLRCSYLVSTSGPLSMSEKDRVFRTALSEPYKTAAL